MKVTVRTELVQVLEVPGTWGREDVFNFLAECQSFRDAFEGVSNEDACALRLPGTLASSSSRVAVESCLCRGEQMVRWSEVGGSGTSRLQKNGHLGANPMSGKAGTVALDYYRY